MKAKAIVVFLAVIAILVLIVFASAAYTVDQTMQAIITQFGKPVGEPITEPGLHFKTPFIQKVHYFERRIMEWDSDHREIPTQDKKFIKADATARWHIVDPLKYFKRVNLETQAQSRLDDIVGGAMKNVITKLNLIESVRSSNREFSVVIEDTFSDDTTKETYNIKVGRHKIGELIKEQANPNLVAFGIELLDVRLRRVNYVDTVRNEVYQRMISERRRMAEFYRSEGQGRQMAIEGEREKKLKMIQSSAYKKAEEIKGEADAKAAAIYAEAYGQDTKFYKFLKTLESYEKTMDTGVDLILTTNSDFFGYLKSLEEKQ